MARTMSSVRKSPDLAGLSAGYGGLAKSCAAFAAAFGRFDAAFDEAATRTGSHSHRLPPGGVEITRRPKIDTTH